MSKTRIPSFLVKLETKEKIQMMEQFKSWKAWRVAELFREHLQGELDRLILEDEKSNFSTWFQTRWSKAKRLGRREQLRQLIKDLQ